MTDERTHRDILLAHSVREERRIVVDLLKVVKEPETGKLVLVDGNVPSLSAGE